MPPRKAAASSTAPAATSTAGKVKEVDSNNVSSVEEEQYVTKSAGTRKRVASREPSTENATQATATDSSEGSVSRKRGKVSKDKSSASLTAPTRVSKRTATKLSSQKSNASTSSTAPKKTSSKSSLKSDAPKVDAPKKPAKEKAPAKVHPPPLNPLPGQKSHPRPPRQLFVFGNGDMGQFGLGTDTLGDITRPRLHKWFDEAVRNGTLGGEGAGLEAVAVGGMHSLVIDELGRVWSWGINDNAALGRITVGHQDPETNEPVDSDVFESQPMVVQSLVDENFRAINVAAGDSVSVAIGEKGEVRAWGSFRSSDGLLGFNGRPGAPRTQFTPIELHGMSKNIIHSVASGTDHVVALDTTGHVFTWGDGQQHQLGRRIIERRRLNGLDPERLALRDIVHVASGAWHSFAIDKEGYVYGWGLNSMGQVGVAPEDQWDETVKVPTIIRALDPEKLGHGRRVISISGGEHHTLFLLNDGTVYACGRCDGHQLGLADDHPAVVEMNKAEEEPQGDGERNEESTDRNAAVDKKITEPVQVFFPPPPTPDDNDPPLPPYTTPDHSHPPITQIIHISAGTRHNLATSKGGIVYSWGYGSQNQLGLGDKEEQEVPARVKSKAMLGWKFEAGYAGGQHCLLVACREQQAEAAEGSK
ncbi:hypothetical protein FRC02_009318 [Tulasnella sp. 418]|nr:hypothetical protein FRC02_009318 [Tulasnella sp. 418]